MNIGWLGKDERSEGRIVKERKRNRRV